MPNFSRRRLILPVAPTMNTWRPFSTASLMAFSIASEAVTPNKGTSLKSIMTTSQSLMALCSRAIALETPKTIGPLR